MSRPPKERMRPQEMRRRFILMNLTPLLLALAALALALGIVARCS